MKVQRTVFGMFIVVFALHVPAAHAYLDPGTGSILIQGLIAAVVGAMVGIRVYWDKFKSMLFRSKNTPADDDSPSRDAE